MVALLEQVLGVEPGWESFRKDLAFLSDFAVTYRYPGESADRESAFDARRRFRYAARHALGASRVGDEIVNAGITGEAFGARIEGETTLGQYEAVVTSIEGRGFVTGHHSFIVDERDPLGTGFLLR